MTYKRRIKKIRKIVDKCSDCGVVLKKYNKHHFRCPACWKEYQLKHKNFSKLTGVPLGD